MPDGVARLDARMRLPEPGDDAGVGPMAVGKPENAYRDAPPNRRISRVRR